MTALFCCVIISLTVCCLLCTLQLNSAFELARSDLLSLYDGTLKSTATQQVL